MFTNPAKNCNKLSTSVLFTSFWGLASPYRKVLQLWYPSWWSMEIFLFLWFCFFYLNLINLIKRSQNRMGWNVRLVFMKYCALNWPNTSQLHMGSNTVILVHCWAQLIRVFEKQIILVATQHLVIAFPWLLDQLGVWAKRVLPACLQKTVWIHVHVYLIT